MKPLVIIPARGGSKGLLRKNIREINGTPLINYSVAAARRVFKDTEIIISTDDIEIKETVERTGLKVPFLRPDALATDTSSMRDVLLHTLSWYSKNVCIPDVIVLLQPTSPLRTSVHLEKSLKKYTNDIDMVVSVKETAANPYFKLFEEDQNGFLKKIKESTSIRRQDVPKVWEYNGAIYIINVNSLMEKEIHQFKRIIKFEMDASSSIDIDSEIDLALCSILMKGKDMEKFDSSSQFDEN